MFFLDKSYKDMFSHNGMKVLIVGESQDFGTTAQTFKRGFESLGHMANIFDLDKEYYSRLDSYTQGFGKPIFRRALNFLLYRYISRKPNSSLLDSIKENNPDLVFVMKGWVVSPKTLLEIKGELPKTKIFYYATDDTLDVREFHNSNYFIRKTMKMCDAYFVWSRAVVSRIKRSGQRNTFWLPLACDTDLHYSTIINSEDKENYKSEVSFVGGWDKFREEWLYEVAKRFDLKIWGDGWEKSNLVVKKCWTGRKAIGEEFSKICKASRISLNFIRQPRYGFSHNMRNFEIPQSEGFQLTTRTDEVNSFFKEGVDVACFSTKKEMLEKIDFYLSNDIARKGIIKKSKKRMKDNAYIERIREVIRVYEGFSE
jgi:spore maturation protein CgeB